MKLLNKLFRAREFTEERQWKLIQWLLAALVAIAGGAEVAKLFIR